jgi:cysteine synthase A
MAPAHPLLLPCALAAALTAGGAGILLYGPMWVRQLFNAQTCSPVKGTPTIRSGLVELIGGTPMVEIPSLSRLTQCRILGKCEFLNPGGSSKDRVAKSIVVNAMARGDLKPGGTVVEGTSGSTGISLALVARSLGLRCVIVMPDDQAQEKEDMLVALGADVRRVKPASIVHRDHYVNVARRLASEIPGGFFANQFENADNWHAHYETTGPEIVRQVDGDGDGSDRAKGQERGNGVDAFVMSAGTGGTISGVSRYLKECDPSTHVVLADPQGSSLFHRVKSGVLYTRQQSERRLRRHRYDTVTEGIGLDRMTHNFEAGVDLIDDAVHVTDQQAASMAHHLLQADGLFVGSSSALNCVAATKLALKLGPGHVVVTMLCGGGSRERSKIHSVDFLQANGLWPLQKLDDIVCESGTDSA